MIQPTLFDTSRPFGGKTFDHKRDGKRLNTQYERVKAYMTSKASQWCRVVLEAA